MPTYQYACTGCGERLEVVQKFTDDPLTVCPACSGALRKVFSPVGVVFKGSGFYKTDSRTKSGSSSTQSGTEKSASETPAATKDAGSTPGSSPTSGATPPASGGSATTAASTPASSSGDRVA